MATVWHAILLYTTHIVSIDLLLWLCTNRGARHAMEEIIFNNEFLALSKRKPIPDPLFLHLLLRVNKFAFHPRIRREIEVQQQLLLSNCSLIVHDERNSNQSSSLFVNSGDEHLKFGGIHHNFVAQNDDAGGGS